MSRVLVAGVNGFVGHHVAHELNDRGIEVFGVGRESEPSSGLAGLIDQYGEVDLTNPQDVARLELAGIDAIINLAGLAKVGESRGQGELYNRVNVSVHTILYEECLKQKVSPRVIAVSTGAVYDPGQPMPITEDSALVSDNNTNEYVISKKLTEQAVMQFNARGLHSIIARPFNHTGPGQLPGFLLPDLYEQIKVSQATGQPLKVGNLKTKRDFTDVRDVARAYVDLALGDQTRLQHDIYNICSGKSIQGEEILRLLAKACGIMDLKTEIDQTRLRANEVMDIYGSHERLTDATNWQPAVPIEQTIRDFVREKEA